MFENRNKLCVVTGIKLDKIDRQCRCRKIYSPQSFLSHLKFQSSVISAFKDNLCSLLAVAYDEFKEII